MFPDRHTSVMDRTIGQSVRHAVPEMVEVPKKLNTTVARRRSAVVVQVLVLSIVLLGFAALTVDVGHLYNVNTGGRI